MALVPLPNAIAIVEQFERLNPATKGEPENVVI
jgi:hypothetical protein